MVVLHAQASTSEVKQKKNRRKMSKKPARTAPAEGAEDLEMVESAPADGEAGDAAVEEAQPETNWNDQDDDVMIDTDPSAPSQADAPAFPALPASAQRSALKSEIRRIPIPPHRMTPLKKDWVNVFSPLTEMLQLQVRMNVQRKCVEIRVCTFIFPSVHRVAELLKRHRSTRRTLVLFRRVPTSLRRML